MGRPEKYIILRSSNGIGQLESNINEHIDGIEYTDTDSGLDEVYYYIPVGGLFIDQSGTVYQAMIQKD